ncbi:MAG: OmpA family protein [Bacteroidales bacterium]|nr:OmpA family protein [Bacteroidales bacterium]
MKKTLIITIFIITYFSAYNQTNDFIQLKDWQLIGYAKSAERFSDNYTAIDYYSEYYKRNKNNDKISFKLANLYFDVKDYQSAKPIYYDLYIVGKKKYSRSLFKYAQILKVEENYNSAVYYFEIYRDNLLIHEEKSKQDLYFFLTEHEIEGCEIADFNDKNKNNIRIHPLNNSINKAHKEYAPIIWNDTLLIYSSLMSDTIPVISVDQNFDLPVDKFYAAKYINNTWQGGFNPPKPFFNYDSLYSSNGVFSDDNKRFYFTVSKKNQEGKLISSIYESRYETGEWKVPEKLDERINLKKYTSTQPAIGKCYNKDFDIIYFVSDRPGGVGGMDIWYTVYDKPNDTYKTPANAGSYINTPGNEITPYFEKSTKTLYFSSDGLAGYGGFDIYKTIGELINWTPSENLGLPLNSGFDDVYYTHNKENGFGFIVSNRSESKVLKSPNCCYDIFQYNLIEKNDLEISGVIYETDNQFVNRIMKDENVNNTISKESEITSLNSIVELHIENKNTGEYIYIETDTTEIDGSFNFNVEEDHNYMLTVLKDNYTPAVINFNTNNIKERLFVLDPVTIIPLQKEPISIDNIYFEFNKWDITNASAKFIDTTLLVIMQRYKDLVIEVSAHTDGIGSDDYNLVLSKNRAESVVNYLKFKGIQRSRIIAKGYGEARPVENETTADGSYIPEAAEQNRRIEFRIIGIIIQ